MSAGPAAAEGNEEIFRLTETKAKRRRKPGQELPLPRPLLPDIHTLQSTRLNEAHDQNKEARRQLERKKEKFQYDMKDLDAALKEHKDQKNNLVAYIEERRAYVDSIKSRTKKVIENAERDKADTIRAARENEELKEKLERLRQEMKVKEALMLDMREKYETYLRSFAEDGTNEDYFEDNKSEPQDIIRRYEVLYETQMQLLGDSHETIKHKEEIENKIAKDIKNSQTVVMTQYRMLAERQLELEALKKQTQRMIEEFASADKVNTNEHRYLGQVIMTIDNLHRRATAQNPPLLRSETDKTHKSLLQLETILRQIQFYTGLVQKAGVPVLDTAERTRRRQERARRSVADLRSAQAQAAPYPNYGGGGGVGGGSRLGGGDRGLNMTRNRSGRHMGSSMLGGIGELSSTSNDMFPASPEVLPPLREGRRTPQSSARKSSTSSVFSRDRRSNY